MNTRAWSPSRATGSSGESTAFVADLPWGVLIFAAVAVLGLVWVAQGHLDHNDYLTAVGGGSGLLAVGHGIRTRR